MNASFRSVRFFFTCAAVLAAQACAPAPQAVPQEPRVITVIVPVTQAAPGSQSVPAAQSTQPAQVEPRPTQEVQVPVTGPQCTALQNINFRKGPGKVFDPPFNVVKKDSVVVPDGFMPLGFPDGSWVHVTRPETGEVGWISADSQLLTCTVDLTGLPVVQAPPTPALVRLRNSKPEGTSNGINGVLHFSPRELLRFEAIGPGGQKDGDYIKEVRFLIRDETGSTTLYDHTERNAPYCVFGGDDGCNPWPRRDGRYVWSQEGNDVKSGATYQMDVLVTSDEVTGNRTGNWSFTITVDLP